MTASKSVHAVAAAATLALASCAVFMSSGVATVHAAALTPSVDVSFISARSQRVTEGLIMKVQPGMTSRDIVTLIGEPAHTMRFPLSRTTSWDYPFVDSWGYASEFSVILDDDGIVVGKVSSRNDY